MDEKRDNQLRERLEALGEETVGGERLRDIAPAVRATGFWSAVFLPWVALGLLFTGLATSYPFVFTLLVVAAFGAAVVGHNHTQR